jgi:geranylgeranyl transferase type-2 subunit beta
MVDREPYLVRLTARLSEGLARQPAETRARHERYLLAAQNTDGGFSGREGGSDLYYTAFGLRGLAVLDALPPDVCRLSATFLRTCLTRDVSVIDLFSLLYSAFLAELAGEPVLPPRPDPWRRNVLALLESCRAPDEGYAKTPGGRSGSVYHTFLVCLCHELLAEPIPCPDKLVAFIKSRGREDGGYVEIAPMKRSGTNPTAAAIGVLTMLDRIDEETNKTAAQFLRSVKTPEGSFRGNSRAPVGDLLSTFTAAWTLQDLEADGLDANSCLAFARSCEMPAGGFRGGLWDDRADVEYTFYGLGCLALALPERAAEGRQA